MAASDTLYVWLWQEAMLSEGQTDGEGSKQKQRKKDSHTMGYMIHTVSVYEKLGQLLVMKIFEKKARVLNTSEHPCEIAPPSHFINKSIDNWLIKAT